MNQQALDRISRANAKRFLKEADIEKTCTQLLELDGWRTIQTDLKRLRGLGVQEKGMADRLYLRYEGGPNIMGDFLPDAEVLWIEYKRPGGKLTAYQKLWIAGERKRGALVLVAGEDFLATIEGFQQWYASSGLQRRGL